ncbi:MAG: hypothetical protein HQK49_06575 [Oligoflexia bacterium]|nr:hypothetical protein [Oligoflexia bacterium]
MKRVIFLSLAFNFLTFTVLAQDLVQDNLVDKYILSQEDMSSVIHAITEDGDLIYGINDFSNTEAAERMIIMKSILIEGTEYELKEIQVDGKQAFLMEDDLVLLLEQGNELRNSPGAVKERQEAREKAERGHKAVDKVVAKVIAKVTTKAIGSVYSTMDSISGDSCKSCDESRKERLKKESEARALAEKERNKKLGISQGPTCPVSRPTPPPSSKGREWHSR